MLGARYDELKEGERADDREGLRKVSPRSGFTNASPGGSALAILSLP